MAIIRLNHFLALSGVASRRSADTLIAEKNVKVDEKVIKELGTKVDTEKQKVFVRKDKDSQWRLVEQVQEKLVYVLYKPRGYTTTLKAQGHEKTIQEFVPAGRRLFPIGRLDKESEGLLILTNDGDLSLKLTHPSSHIEKTYKVVCRIPKEYTENAVESQLGRVRNGIRIDGRKTLPMKTKILGIRTGMVELEIVLSEGRNRQIRRVMGRINMEVVKLIRTKIGSLSLDKLEIKEGEILQLSEEEIAGL